MAEPLDHPETGVAADGGGGVRRGWRDLWQVPTIVASLGLIALGIVVAANRAPEEDWDGALDEVRRMIGVGELDEARDRLVGVLEPNLARATPRQRGRFHAIAADWIGASQEARAASVPDNNLRIDEQYALAVELGVSLDGERIERWGRALVELGRLDDARDRVVELEVLADTGRPEAARRRNRLLRMLVERSLRQADLPADAMIARLETYREDPRLEDVDRAWAIDRQAALRIEAGDFQPAIDALLLEMRRMEGAELDADTWAGFYVRLADAQWRLGRTDDALFQLDEADRRFENQTLLRGRGLLLRARIDVERADRAAALPRLDTIVSDYPGTELLLPARLLRAEVLAAAGEHDSALEDYAAARELLRTAGSRRDVTPRDVVQSIGDRRDTMMAAGDLEVALRYALAAEGVFADDPDAAPVDVLERIAAINEQIADRLLAGARAAIAAEAAAAGDAIDPADVPESSVPAAVRAEAQARLADAADSFMRHARRLLGEPGRAGGFTTSLWAAADAWERAGRPDEAIEAMETYLGGGDSDDPRRPEVMFRLGRVLESIGRLEDAAARYRQVIEEDPRTVGTRAHAPLARTLLALGRVSEAEEVLLAVVEGRQAAGGVLTPDAADYRRALVDLGRLHYEHATTLPGPDGSPEVDPGLARDRIRRAIERFDAALVRDPEADDADEIRFWLADSHRRLADLLADGGVTPAERERFALARAAHLETALGGYETVIEAWRDDDPRLMDRRRRTMLRNAYMSRARATYDLERWEQAARLYDVAARRYADDHVSMQALVQIVNCWERMGEAEKADVAHRNALLRLEQLPDAAFEGPGVLMDRDAWSEWLRNRPVGRVAAATPDEGGAP